jgi:hypothetical protein
MIGLPVVLLLVAQSVPASEPVPEHSSKITSVERFWQGEIGRGLVRNTRSLEVKLSRAFGTTTSGSNVSHDLWLAQIQGGLILADVMEPNYWFGGNLEGIIQFMAGAQDNPHSAYFLASNAGLRYHFRTGTPFVPFIGGSIGVGVTDIDDADATGKFQFNQQATAGVRYFFNPSTALTFDYSLWHISNAGMREPNDGVNAHVLSLGLVWLF